MIFFLNKSKWNILLKRKVIHPTQDVLTVMNQSNGTYQEVATTKKEITKLHDTHTGEWVSPPIKQTMIIYFNEAFYKKKKKTISVKPTV